MLGQVGTVGTVVTVSKELVVPHGRPKTRTWKNGSNFAIKNKKMTRKRAILKDFSQPQLCDTT